MWVFANFGLIMPAAIDEDLTRRPDWAEYSEDGKYDFQVRGRIIDHLRYFQDNFMEEGTYHRDILSTPDHDYNYRFYTTQEAFAMGMAKAVMAIDYRKFKPSSMQFEWGNPYHDILNRIWGTVCDMNTPGDIWGPWTPENPKGYRSSSKYNWGSNFKASPGRRIGDSFENIDFGDGTSAWEEDDEEAWYDYRAESIIEEMDENNIAMADWPENLTPNEFELVRPELRKHFSKKVVNRMAARNRLLFVAV